MLDKEDFTDAMVEEVESAVGMGHGAWDCVSPKEICAAAANVAVVNNLVARLDEPAPSALPADARPGLINGKTPWEFACNWYKPGEIAYSIARSKNYGFGSFALSAKIPADVYSEEFADWLTEQYRLAMAKGIEIGQRAALRGQGEG